ncbi:sensor diguanylate cyclase, GAF domain-containing [Desulfuromonas sp. DDH964]|uniref:GAF domain-containing protein n=1 Tax=Desulfuromonas sp. DDH964 TaxID=1823759 RepID=UPI00078B7A4F|nr:GAF domain-containing protein [Desulfuromonas sp. DDH964]AMV72324.1 sensor diguanylate cyclase, GAF domain-containing [Desulfuromonas sp. DDH964]
MPQTNPNEYFRLFFETAQAILSAENLQAILDSLVQRTVAALDIKGGSLRLIDEESNSLKQVASYGLSDAYLNKGALNADQSIPEVLAGQPVCIRNAPEDPRIQYPEEMRAEGINTVLSVPVIAAEKVIGVLRLYSSRPRNYSGEDLEFVSALAEMGGLAISNARLAQAEGDKLAALFSEIGVDQPDRFEFEKPTLGPACLMPVDSARSLTYFRTLHEITRALLSTRESKQVVQLIVDQAVAVMKVKASALRLRNETTHELELIATSGLSAKFLAKGQPHTDQSIAETLAGRPVLILDTANDPRLEYPAETVAEGIQSILSMPIVARHRVVGVLRLYSAEKRQYSQEEITFLSALAEIAGVAIMNARLYEKTRNDLSFWAATLGYMQD